MQMTLHALACMRTDLSSELALRRADPLEVPVDDLVREVGELLGEGLRLRLREELALRLLPPPPPPPGRARRHDSRVVLVLLLLRHRPSSTRAARVRLWPAARCNAVMSPWLVALTLAPRSRSAATCSGQSWLFTTAMSTVTPYLPTYVSSASPLSSSTLQKYASVIAGHAAL